MLSGPTVIVGPRRPPWRGAVAALKTLTSHTGCIVPDRYVFVTDLAATIPSIANYRAPMVLTEPASPIICPHLNVVGGITDKDRKCPRSGPNQSGSVSVGEHHRGHSDDSEQARYFSKVKQADGKIEFA